MTALQKENIYSIPPIRLANEESRSPPMVLLGGGVAGGMTEMPEATGVPMLPAVLPAVLPPVLWGVTAGISKSPNPSNTWVIESRNQRNNRDYKLAKL